jgi:hypothetical protein
MEKKAAVAACNLLIFGALKTKKMSSKSCRRFYERKNRHIKRIGKHYSGKRKTGGGIYPIWRADDADWTDLHR